MPGPAFFRNLGLFAVESFIEQSVCAELCTDLRDAALQKGTIVLSSNGTLLDEKVRSVFCAHLRGAKERFVAGRLESLRPTIQEHFKTPLSGVEHPEFLIYRQGGFYTTHTDANRNPASSTY